MIRTLIILPFLCLVTIGMIHAQDNSSPNQPDLINISGIIFSTDSIKALPYVSIYVNHLPKGTVSSNTGYFSLDASPRDTLFFSAVGYKTTQYILPNYLVGQHYSIVQGLVRDTILLEEVIISSLPTTSEFMESFSDNDLDFADRVESMQTELKTLLEEDIVLGKYQPTEGITRMYNTDWGLVPPNNFLNPIRWTQFVRDLRKHRSNEKAKPKR
ncbi:MAG: carboxypeptidase-like regulatory domain-containing protein [Bacteroidota bacterium]